MYPAFLIKILLVIILQYSSWELDVVDPPVFIVEQYKTGCKRNGYFRLEILNKPAEVICKILFPDPRHFLIMFSIVMDLVGKITCTAPARQHEINFWPS